MNDMVELTESDQVDARMAAIEVYVVALESVLRELAPMQVSQAIANAIERAERQASSSPWNEELLVQVKRLAGK